MSAKSQSKSDPQPDNYLESALNLSRIYAMTTFLHVSRTYPYRPGWAGAVCLRHPIVARVQASDQLSRHLPRSGVERFPEDGAIRATHCGVTPKKCGIDRQGDKTMFLTTENLEHHFATRLADASRVDIATAWATEGPVLDLLCDAARNRRVKVRAIVGTYGNATDPDALERLDGIGKLRLVDGSGALFHPKVYVFRGARGDRAWIGSANFTGAGFARNEEAVHETQDVAGAVSWFETRWQECGRLASGAIDAYRRRRQEQRVSKSLVGLVRRPEEGGDDRLALLAGATSWKGYVRALEKCDEIRLYEDRYWSVLGKSRSYVHTIENGRQVARRKSWIGLNDLDRITLLGLGRYGDGAWGLLGTLFPAGTVKGVFNRSDQGKNKRILRRIRSAVEPVINASDGDFPDVAVTALEKICREKGFGPGTATRFLALARPDRLVSVNNESRHGLAETFGLNPTTLGNPRNYRKLLQRLYAKRWYNDRQARKRERRLWNMRAALVDCFVYDSDGEA